MEKTNMITYLFIGIVFGFFVELVRDAILKQYPTLYPWEQSKDPYNIIIRLVLILLWPIGLIIFSYGFYRSYFKK